MSVHRREYQPYQGVLTHARWRFWVVARYALGDLLVSRLLLAFLFVAGIPILAAAVMIYVAHHPTVLLLIGLTKLDSIMAIDPAFFRHTLSTQCFLGLILTAWVGPGLVASDLANGALPLYLSRPLSRFEYVLGKASVLVLLLSCMTWIPGLLLYLLNAALADPGWWLAHARIAVALFVGSVGWIAVMALLGLSISAWIKWRLAASSMLFALYFVSAGLGETVAALLRVSWGRVISLGHLFEVVWSQLFGTPPQQQGVSPTAAWLGLASICGFSIFVLHQRLRARQPVR